MKIITWNINGYRAVTGQNPSKRYDTVTKNNKLFSYVEKENPDIICLQEIKADVEQIDAGLRCPPGYKPFYHTCSVKKGYSGVATFSKIEPVNANNKFGIEEFDGEGRFIELDFGSFVLLNIYFPKGYADNDRLDYKLRFYDAIFDYTNKLRKKGKNLIMCGDYNTAHKPIDLARPKENEGTSGFMPVERVKLDWMVENGWIDTFRHLNKNAETYTWWSQRGRARENNIGWRIDYHFITDTLKPKLISSYIQDDEIGSDHCPVVIEIEI